MPAIYLFVIARNTRTSMNKDMYSETVLTIEMGLPMWVALTLMIETPSRLSTAGPEPSVPSPKRLIWLADGVIPMP
jgi:hypothetical protein